MIPIVKKYLGSLDLDADTACTITQYLRLISARASGKIQTNATWIRNFVTSHPKYKYLSKLFKNIYYLFISFA